MKNMYTCICNALNEDKVKEIINENEITTISELKTFGVCDICTKCFDPVNQILEDCIDERFKDEDWYISPKEKCHWSLE